MRHEICSKDYINDDGSGFLARLKRRDPIAEEELFRRYYRVCFRIAMSILKDEDEASDQAQAALLRALIHIGNFEGRAQIGSWLTRIVINGCFMRLRRNQRWRMIEVSECSAHIRMHTQAEQSPESLLEDQEIRALIRRR